MFSASIGYGFRLGIPLHENHVSINELEDMRKEPEYLFFINKIGSPSTTIFRSSVKEVFDNKLDGW